MRSIFGLLERVGWLKIKKAVSETHLETAGRESVIRLETIVKTGSPTIILPMQNVYAHFEEVLGEHTAHFLFPRTVSARISPTCALFAIEPKGECTLEQIIFRTVAIAKMYGWQSRVVRTHTHFISALIKRVLGKLIVLHRPIQSVQRGRELGEFTQELICGLKESLRRANIRCDDLCLSRNAGAEGGVVCLAHRDLGLPNIMVNEENDVFFIDPRAHVVSACAVQRGARFASPAIDLAGFAIGLARIELEIQRRQASFRLSAIQYVRHEIDGMLRDREITPFLLRLSETVVWAGYAACQCSQCRDPCRAWLRQRSIMQAKQCLKALAPLA